MKLMEYLDQRKLTYEAAIKELGDLTLNRALLGKWARGECIPSKHRVELIYHWSQGLVEPNDFYNLELPF